MAKQRTIVFMDYQNVHGWARRKFLPHGSHPASGHVDPLRVGLTICKRRKFESELAKVRVYRGRPNPDRQEKAARANDRQTAVWQRSPLVHVVRRNLQYPHNYPTQPASEKGIDVAIAVDMIRLAMEGAMDAAVLFSSDTDLLPAIEAIREQQLCHVEVAAWAKGNALRFPKTSAHEPLWCHSFNDAEYRTLQDTTDYAANDYAD